jgi:hypothetical protein
VVTPRVTSPYLRMLSQRLGRLGEQQCLNAAEIQVRGT